MIFSIKLYHLPAFLIFLFFGMTDMHAQKLTQNDKDTACNTAKGLAAKDIQTNSLKYYAFGIVSPSQDVITAMQEKYHIQLVPLGCVVSPNELCYNDAINEYAVKHWKKTVSELMNDVKAK